MNIYVGNTKKKAEKISLYHLLNHILQVNRFETDTCECAPNNEGKDGTSVLSVMLKDKEKEITVSICFDDVDGVQDLNKINRINVWQAPIVTKVDYDKQKKLI